MTTLHNASPEYLQQCREAQAAEQAASLAATQQWAHVDKARAHQDFQCFYEELAPLIDGADPSSPAIQERMVRHHAIVSRFYAPTREAYIGTALFYAENPDMKAFHSTYHPRLVEFLGEAVYAYAHRHL